MGGEVSELHTLWKSLTAIFAPSIGAFITVNKPALISPRMPPFAAPPFCLVRCRGLVRRRGLVR